MPGGNKVRTRWLHLFLAVAVVSAVEGLHAEQTTGTEATFPVASTMEVATISYESSGTALPTAFPSSGKLLAASTGGNAGNVSSDIIFSGESESGLRSKADPNPHLRAHPDVLELPGTFGSDCGYCYNCLDPEKHRYEPDEEDAPDRGYGETFHTCSSGWSEGTCPERHPESSYCGGGSGSVAALGTADRERIWRLAATVDLDGLASALAEFEGSTRLNEHRSAIQVFGCRGEVTLSIPVPVAQARYLAQATQK